MTAARGNCDPIVLRGVIDLPEITSSESLAGYAKARVVERVNPIRAQLQSHSLSELKTLGDRQVKDSQARSSERVSTLIAECERQARTGCPCVLEGRSVKPLVRVRIADVRGRNNVGEPVAACSLSIQRSRSVRVLTTRLEQLQFHSGRRRLTTANRRLALAIRTKCLLLVEKAIAHCIP